MTPPDFVLHWRMPYVSMFYGIIIRMFHNDHNPPHFYAVYQGQRAVFDFNGNMQSGNLTSKSALRMIREWAKRHKVELKENWELARDGKNINQISPLE